MPTRPCPGDIEHGLGRIDPDPRRADHRRQSAAVSCPVPQPRSSTEDARFGQSHAEIEIRAPAIFQIVEPGGFSGSRYKPSCPTVSRPFIAFDQRMDVGKGPAGAGFGAPGGPTARGPARRAK